MRRDALRFTGLDGNIGDEFNTKLRAYGTAIASGSIIAEKTGYVATTERSDENAPDESGSKLLTAVLAVGTGLALAGAYANRERISDWLSGRMTDPDTDQSRGIINSLKTIAEGDANYKLSPGTAESLTYIEEKFPALSGILKNNVERAAAKMSVAASMVDDKRKTIRNVAIGGAALAAAVYGTRFIVTRYGSQIARGYAMSKVMNWLSSFSGNKGAAGEDLTTAEARQSLTDFTDVSDVSESYAINSVSGKVGARQMDSDQREKIQVLLANAHAVLTPEGTDSFDADDFVALTFLLLDKLPSVIDDAATARKLGWLALGCGAALVSNQPILVIQKPGAAKLTADDQRAERAIAETVLSLSTSFGIVTLASNHLLEGASASSENPILDKNSVLSTEILLESFTDF